MPVESMLEFIRKRGKYVSLRKLQQKSDKSNEPLEYVTPGLDPMRTNIHMKGLHTSIDLQEYYLDKRFLKIRQMPKMCGVS